MESLTHFLDSVNVNKKQRILTINSEQEKNKTILRLAVKI